MDIVLIRVGNRNCLVDLGRENSSKETLTPESTVLP